MLQSLEAETLMQDAREMQAEGVRLMDAGDWRDAAEKGWLAVRNATAALVWDVTGVRNRTSSHVNAGIRKLAQERGGEWVQLRRAYADAMRHLHSMAFYDGVYNDDLPDLVRNVADYIRRAEALAG